MLPSNRTLDCYCFDLSKPKCALDEMVKCIVNNTNSTVEEAASCLLTVLFTKFEDSYVSTCIKRVLLKGASPNKWIL